MAAQRLFALACACEDINDHQALRTDPAIQLAAGHYLQLTDAD